MDELLQFAPSGPFGVGAAVMLAYLVAVLVVHVALALGVYQDAQDRRTLFVGPLVWALATLLTGLLGAMAYWFAHCSRLARVEDRSVKTEVRRR
jgi:hypothetical protein